ncbi:MAG: RnfH family protein [Variovorax sp.]
MATPEKSSLGSAKPDLREAIPVAAARVVKVTLVYASGPRVVFEEELHLPPGSSAAEAFAASRLRLEQPDIDTEALEPGVWGRAVEWHGALQDGDRLELCRALAVDPKTARRERFKRQGSRAVGLFARPKAMPKADASSA